MFQKRKKGEKKMILKVFDEKAFKYVMFYRIGLLSVVISDHNDDNDDHDSNSHII